MADQQCNAGQQLPGLPLGIPGLWWPPPHQWWMFPWGPSPLLSEGFDVSSPLWEGGGWAVGGPELWAVNNNILLLCGGVQQEELHAPPNETLKHCKSVHTSCIIYNLYT